MLVSVIICTRNRAAELQQTLGLLAKVKIPIGWRVELLVVDNGSEDNTAGIVGGTRLPNIEVKNLCEARKGKSNALNTGLASAKGEIILFTDDDIRPSERWLEELATPLADHRCDAIIGRIILASDLQKAWMGPMHKWWLASTDDAEPYQGLRELIGANMGIRRTVLEYVPGFDPELGPGALGLFEDTLFGWRLVEAGLTIGYAPKACAIHQPSPSRLKRASWLEEARKHGRCQGYLRHHWEHASISVPRLRQLYYFIKLQLRRVIQRPLSMQSEGCAPWEISYVGNIEMYKQFCLERRRPRNYKRGESTMRPSPIRPSNGEIPVSIPAANDKP